MARTTAVPRTLSMLREQGYLADVVEQYNAYSGQRKDLFGVFDILAIDSVTTIGVQVCGQDFSSHVRKMTEERGAELVAWLEHPMRAALLVGWRKLKAKRGGKQMVYRPRIMVFDREPGDRIVMREFKDEETIKEILYGSTKEEL